MAHKKEVEEIDGYYVSSSLPKAFIVPPSSVRFRPRESVRDSKKRESQKRELKKKGFEIRPHTVDVDYKECLPVEGRQHLSIQTDLYLEEICDVVEEVDAQTETDPLLDRAPSPLFIPEKYGIDVETQIYPGELFDFDEKVEPTLEALVSETIEQAVVEITAEDELAILADSQMNLETKRSAGLEELKRLEEEERRILEEKQRQLKEKEEAITLEDEVAQKIAATIFSQNYLAELVPQVYEKLDAAGYFDAEESESNEVEDNFWAWLLNEVDSEIATLEASNQLLDNLIQNTTETPDSIKPTVQNIYPDGPKDISDEEQDTSKQNKNEEASNVEEL